MSKHWIIILTVLGMIIGQRACSQTNPYPHSVFNWGIRAGVNALSTNFYEVSDGSLEISQKSYKNKVGYNISTFTRINVGRLLMQPEFAWNTYSQSLSFILTDADNS
jgi:hypothetical protein